MYLMLASRTDVLAGAIIVILTIGVGPTLQQTVRFRTVSVPDQDRNATTPVAQIYYPPQSHVGARVSAMDLPMKAAILDGLLTPNSNNTGITIDCPTGN